MGSTNWYENNNYVSLPPGVLSVNQCLVRLVHLVLFLVIFLISSIKSFLNDIYAMTHGQILHYYMTSQYLETLDWVTNNNNNRRVKFNEHQGRLYLDFDFDELQSGDYILVEVTDASRPRNLYSDV